MTSAADGATGAPRFVARWDLDKTYLRSRFDTLSELLSSALEKAEDKRAIPGATALLRELSAAGARIHILSGSPRQLRRKLEAKLTLDGVKWDELTLKPNLSNLVRLRFRALRDQLGYKLPELLLARARDERRFVSPHAMHEVLVGDDSESDAFVYSLYADICAGAVDEKELGRVLEAGRAYERTFEQCRRALESIRPAPVVDRILIHLDGQTPPSHFARYGARLVPFYNYLQASLVLVEGGTLSPGAGLRIAAEFLSRHGFSPDTVARSYAELRSRGHGDGTAPAALAIALGELSPEAELPSRELEAAVHQMTRESPTRPQPRPENSPLDYVELAGHYRSGRNRRRPGQRFGWFD